MDVQCIQKATDTALQACLEVTLIRYNLESSTSLKQASFVTLQLNLDNLKWMSFLENAFKNP